MAAIDKKLIHFNSELNFNTALLNNQIKDTSIVFVGDHDNAIGKKIYTHGETFYTHYEGNSDVNINQNQFSLGENYIKYFESEDAFNVYITEVGGEDNVPAPCVILIADIGAVYYVS